MDERIFTKICGLQDRDAVRAAVDAGADALGFVFADSPRRVTPEQARELTADLPPGIMRVAVMRHPRAEEWEQVRTVFGPDWLQTEAADFTDLPATADVTRVHVHRDSGETDVTAMTGRVLFEAARSGVGERANWSLAAEIARHTQLILAGGLDSHNVAQAIHRVRPWGVDVSSGVEHSRGEKDAGMIAAFIRAVRAAEQADAD